HLFIDVASGEVGAEMPAPAADRKEFAVCVTHGVPADPDDPSRSQVRDRAYPLFFTHAAILHFIAADVREPSDVRGSRHESKTQRPLARSYGQRSRETPEHGL